MRNTVKGKAKGYPILVPKSYHDEFVADFLSVMDITNAKAATLSEDLAFKFKYQSEKWRSKYSDPTTTPAETRRAAAIKKWLGAELRNEVTNGRLLVENTTFTGGVTSEKIVRFARLVIRQVIGDSPPDTLFGEFSNGASTRVTRSPDAIARKFVGEAHVTPEAFRVFSTSVLERSPAWVYSMFQGAFTPVEQEGSMMFTVPKDSEIDRVACKEPEINMFLQRGVGLFLRSALKKRRIDLKDQSHNQRLALEGSVSRRLATLDLSSASDLISTQLVYSLLPLDWFLLLDSIRVKRVLIDGEWHELHMFSSMGNGFTFELESLLFYALTCAINRAYGVRGHVSVYGDDIITPNSIAPAFPAIFSWFGFKVNSSKSFWTGKFRESCGKHYYDGTDVSPFFIRERITTLLDLIHQLNLLRQWATRNGDDFWTPELYSFWVRWSARIPSRLKGGKNVEDKSCLATPHNPRRRLQAEKRVVSAPDEGAYLQWLLARSKVQSFVFSFGCGDNAPTRVKREVALSWVPGALRCEALVTSAPELDLDVYRLVKNRVWDWSLNHLWYSEYASDDAFSERLLTA